MLNKHVKSPCCGVRVIRYGGKRRQCVRCLKTWRIRRSRRGRKFLRVKINYVRKVFLNGLAIRRIPTTARVTNSAIGKRFSTALNRIMLRPRRYRMPGRRLILLVDAQWHYFKRKLWTLYFIAVRSTDKEEATILNPILKSGKENLDNWIVIIDNLPNSIKKRLIAAVSDGLPGLNNVFRKRGWIVQRCHFHLIAELQKRRARKRNLPGKSIREAAYQTIRELLVTVSASRKNFLVRRLGRISNDPECPAKIKMIAREFVRCLDEFHAYLKYPELNLPNTNNLMESVGSLVRNRSLKLRTPSAWHKWATTTIKFHPKFICKRAKIPTELIP